MKKLKNTSNSGGVSSIFQLRCTTDPNNWKLNGLTVLIAEATMQNDFKSFNTHKICEKRHSGDHFNWEL